jgi:hypothetical protein
MPIEITCWLRHQRARLLDSGFRSGWFVIAIKGLQDTADA